MTNWNSSLRGIKGILLIAAVVCFLGVVLKLSSDKNQLWDFKNYYAPVKVMQAGLDPYDENNFKLVFPDGDHKRWQYPPITLTVFRPFGLLPYEKARQLWLALNLILLSLLIVVWHQYVLRLSLDVLTCWFFLFAFNGTLIWALASGNIVLFEHLLLFVGIGHLLKRQYFAFAIYTALCAQFKLVPAAFLVLLLIAGEKPRWKAFFFGSILFVGIFATNYIFYPDLVPQFFAKATTDQLDPPSDVSLLNAATTFSNLAALRMGLSEGRRSLVPDVLYVFAAGAIICISYIVFNRSREWITPRLTVLYFCVVYCLTVPRLLAYSLVTGLISTLLLLRLKDNAYRVPLVAAFVLPVFYYPVAEEFFQKLRLFAPLIAVGVVWIVFSRLLLDRTASALLEKE